MTQDANSPETDNVYNAIAAVEHAAGEFLKTEESKVVEGAKRIFAVGEHDVWHRDPPPVHLVQAQALPLAGENDLLHEVERVAITAFMDVGDVLRKVYLNIHGRWVKA